MTLDRPTHVELDCSLTREFINRKLLLTFHIFPGLHAFISLLHPLPSCSRYHSQALFAQEALLLMFDGTGRLVCEPDLETAPALALLLMHDDVVTKENNTM